MIRLVFRRPYIFASVLVLIGAALLWGGGTLVSLGGSPYYLGAGAATLVSGVLVALGKRAGAYVYAAMIAASVTWSVWEVGSDLWSLSARLIAPLVLGAWFLMPWTWRRLSGASHLSIARALAAIAVAVIGTAAVGMALHAGFAQPMVDPLFQAGMESRAPDGSHPANPVAATDWPSWGGDAGGSRFSQLAEITPQNVHDLQLAWTFRFGPSPAGAPGTLEGTPLKIDDTLYACSDYNDVVALDAENGRLKWRFRANVDTAGAIYGHCRGVAYHRTPGPVGLCSAQVFTNTIDARLIALDARTGTLCPNFGNDGVVALRTGLSLAPQGYYYVTSAPTVAKDQIVVGGWVTDGGYIGEPSGVIRAFDVHTGKLTWAFDMGSPNRIGAPASGEVYTPGTPNSWAPMSVDEKLGMIYAPLGGAVLDYVGQKRRPFDEQYSGTVLALDIRTGRPRWKFQTVRHDLWDYDAPAQPTLVDVPTAAGLRPALIQSTKRGEMFVLDRETGRPLIPITEHRAPQRGTAPGERAAPMQPYSDDLPSFRGPLVTEKSMWGITPLDQLWCRIKFRQARYDGPLTPPGLSPSIVFPGFLGGSDWGGVTVDTDRQLLIANTNQVANYVQLWPRALADRLGIRPLGIGGPPKPGTEGVQAHLGTPYAADVVPFLSPIGAPCQAPPWGRISAIDLVTHKLVWSHPIGTARDSGPFGLASQIPFRIGTPNLGGSVATRGGVIFIGATQDNYLRALDTATGEVLWRARLAAGAQATPISYLSKASGRQFVVIAAGGHLFLKTTLGDYIYAFALPKVRGNR